ncbi:MAG: TIGR02757 family protein [Sediminibacterium sp.]
MHSLEVNEELREALERSVDKYNRRSFIEEDPISIPHSFAKKEDIEIAAFLTATISWGNRKSILVSANRLMEYMDRSPFDFVLNAQPEDFNSWKPSIHRTFMKEDVEFFVKSLRRIYLEEGGMEVLFTQGFSSGGSKEAIEYFRNIFVGSESHRALKHVASPQRNSTAKRINMFLRWMVRNDNRGVDFGLWKGISPSQLSIPLDVHSGRTARMFGLLSRTQSDWKAVEELDSCLRLYDSFDPVKYDFALFGLSEAGFEK